MRINKITDAIIDTEHTSDMVAAAILHYAQYP